jgi:excisionase family DNA binding protein
MRNLEFDRMLTTKEAARLLGIGSSMLERLRWMGEGPPYVRPSGGRAVRYRQGDIHSWIASHLITPGGEMRR